MKKTGIFRTSVTEGWQRILFRWRAESILFSETTEITVRTAVTEILEI